VDAELSSRTRGCARRSSATGSMPRWLRLRVHRLRGRRHLSLGLPDRPSLRVCPHAAQGEPAIVFPAEARYVGEHGDSQIADQVFADRPGEWLAERLRGQRVGVYGLDYVLTVRDYAALAAPPSSSRGTSSSTSLARSSPTPSSSPCARASKINVAGFHAFHRAWAPGRTAADVLAPAEELFVERGCGRLTMNMVLVGAEFAIARDDTVFGEFTIPRSRSPGRAATGSRSRARSARRAPR
jgi:hypothetical protein